MEGRQTVPRAELSALLMVAKDMAKTSDASVPFQVYSDASYVTKNAPRFRSIHGPPTFHLNRLLSGSNGDLWNHLMNGQIPHWSINKVPSHVSYTVFQGLGLSVNTQVANVMADFGADLAASAAQHSDN